MTMLVVPVPEGRTPMFADCGNDACDHLWVAVWLPMEMSLAAQVLQALRCPLCGHSSPRGASTEAAERMQIVTPERTCSTCGRSSVEHILGQACTKFTQEADHG